jgi:hypothetical protein
VNSTTVNVSVDLSGASLGAPVRARLFPEFGSGSLTFTLAANGPIYSGTLTVTEPALTGQLQVWVDEVFSEQNPRRETIVAYSIGGNPGSFRAGGGSFRAGGGSFRAGGGSFRAGGGSFRAGGAPLISPDGQMIFFTENPIIFQEGQFFTVQGMAALPSLPPGRVVIGTGYRLIATPGTPVLTGSVSIQYLSNDVTVAGANEDGLSIYFYNGTIWQELPTTRSTYFNLATAPSQGVGVYALMASVQVPLYAPGWNLFAYPLLQSQAVTQALASINGYYSHVYGYYAEDTADPWKLYWVNAPITLPVVNDLLTLDFGRGYWISTTQAITIYLNPTPSALAPETTLALPASPPDTFFGAVMGDVDFTPVAGQIVQAYVSGALCGQGQTQALNGQVVYVIDVLAKDGAHPDCGQMGRWVTFTVDGRRMNAALWDNALPTELTLAPAKMVYLPVVRR